jgi:hypothetical protein
MKRRLKFKTYSAIALSCLRSTFENNETHFAGKTYDNLSFKCQPEKVLFADGSKVEASH